MKQSHIDFKRVIIVLFFATIAVAIASLTIGRDIYENKGMTVLSFAIVNFSGYLFFLFMPVELAFIFYLKTGYDPWILNLIALGTAVLSQSVDYLIGYFLSSGVIDRLIGRSRHKKAEAEIRKYGNLTLLVFNLFPLSSPVIALAAGMLKYRIKDVLLYSIAGLVLKYLVLTLIF
ncbi:MAG: VTT domain-containing protein [Bacteroidota bacterium]|nr:VTT domain-containing protein [Bacteroidota bacterium]